MRKRALTPFGGLAAALALVVLPAAIAAAPEPGFSRSVTARLVQQYATRFGSDARGRLTRWQRSVAGAGPTASDAKAEAEVLARVNDFVNRLTYTTDLRHWQVEDYWATPAESFGSDGGDCEDFAIAKYFALKELGVPLERFRFVYVTATASRELHMILAYYATPNSVPLVLDNLYGRIVPATQRPDLTPVYSFNDEDVPPVQAGRRSSYGATPAPRRWKELVERLQAELVI